MKSKLLLILFLSCGCLFSAAQEPRVTLKIRNVQDEVRCLLPIDHEAVGYAYKAVFSGADTVFQTLNPRYVTALFFGDKIPRVATPVAAHDAFTITVNPADSLQPIIFEGDNAAGRQLFQQLANQQDLYRYEWVRDFTKFPLDTNATLMAGNFKQIVDREIAQFTTLYKKKKITKPFYEFAKADIELYYTTVLSKVFRCNYAVNRDSVAGMYPGYFAAWKQLYEQHPMTADLYRHEWGFPYSEEYFHFFQDCALAMVDQKPIRPNSPSEYWASGLSRAVKTLDGQAAKCYKRSMIYQITLNNKTYDRGVLGLIDDFKAKYPGSEINDYFEEYAVGLNDYYEKIKSAFVPEVKLLEGYDTITTFKEVLSRFKGQNLFIDFWFSTCGPCNEEFKYGDALRKFLAANHVTMLYVSVDRPKLDSVWRNAIKYNDLYGYHVRTCQRLHADLYDTYKIGAFPTYMIVNADGEIVVPRAKRPAQGEELYKQIKESLKL